MDAAKLALHRDPRTLNKAVQFTQTAAHNHKLLSRSSRPSVRHVSFRDPPYSNVPYSDPPYYNAPSVQLTLMFPVFNGFKLGKWGKIKLT